MKRLAVVATIAAAVGAVTAPTDAGAATDFLSCVRWAIESPVLDGLDAQRRLTVGAMQLGSNTYTALSSGERAVLRVASHIDCVARDLPHVDDLWRDRIGDALARTAATAWSGVPS